MGMIHSHTDQLLLGNSFVHTPVGQRKSQRSFVSWDDQRTGPKLSPQQTILPVQYLGKISAQGPSFTPSKQHCVFNAFYTCGHEPRVKSLTY